MSPLSAAAASSRAHALLITLSLLGMITACDRESRTEATATKPQAQESQPSAEQPPRRAIDAHTHLSPLAYPVIAPHMERIGLQRVVNMSGGAQPEYQAKHIALAERMGGRVLLFANVDWTGVDDPDFGERAAAALRDAVGLGYAGLKISKALGLGVKTADGAYLKVDDPRLDPLWEAAGELGVPVAIHTGDPKAFFEPPGPQNERHAELSRAPSWSFHGDEFPSRASLLAARDRVVARHPDTDFILLHFANNPEDVDYVERLLDAHPNAYVDVAARIGEIGRHDPKKMRRILQKHRDRVIFATDLQLSARPASDGSKRFEYRLTLGSVSNEPPTLDDIAPFYAAHWRYFEERGEPIDHPVPIQGDWKVKPVGLSAEALDEIYWKNAERLIAAPALGRQAAQEVVARASSPDTPPPSSSPHLRAP